MPENSCPGIALDRCRAIRIMTGGIPELLCRSPSSGVDLNQDFSRLRFRYGTCYRLKGFSLSVNSIAFISGIALLLEFAVSITRSVHAIEVSVVSDRISRSVSSSIQKLVQRARVRLPERQ